MRKAPLLPIALAIMAGIIVAHLAPDVATSVWLWAMAGCAVLVTLSFPTYSPPPSNSHKTRTIAAVMLLCASLGATLKSTEDHNDWTRHVPDKTYLSVRLTETPQPRGKTIYAKADVLTANRRHCGGAIDIFFRADSTAATLRYGDRLLIHGYPNMERRSIYLTSDHYLLQQRDTVSLRARSEALRLWLLRRMQSGPMPRRQGAVAEALTLGWCADIDHSTKEAYRDAGLAHLLAVSGLHVGLLAAIVGTLFFRTGNERRGRIIRGSAQLIAIWFFALLSGLAPSTQRAALMFSLFIISNITGRRTPRLNLLAAAAIITLLGRPSLLFNVGWQLSYSAVAGLILASPIIRAYRSFMWKNAMMSLAATTATLPVTIATFHRFHPYFLIANVIVVPAAFIILALSLLYMAIPCAVTAWPATTILRLVEALVDWVATLPGATIVI